MNRHIPQARTGFSPIPPRAPQARAPQDSGPAQNWDIDAYIEDNGLISADSDLLQPGALPEPVTERLVALSDKIEDLTTQIDGSAAEADSADVDWDRAKIDLANAEQAEVSDAQITRLRAKVQKALQRRADASRHQQRLIAERENVKKLLASARRYLEGKRTFAPDGAKQFAVDFIDVDIPDGDPVDVVTVQRTEIARLRAERQAVAAAPIPLDDAKARVRNYVRMRGLEAEVSARTDGPVKLRLPTRRLDVPSNPDGSIPQTVDVEALLCRYMPDQLLADLERNLDAEYEGVDLALAPHEQHRKLKEIDRAIIDAERIEVAACWEAIEASADVGFRPDTSPAALLGVN